MKYEKGTRKIFIGEGVPAPSSASFPNPNQKVGELTTSLRYLHTSMNIKQAKFTDNLVHLRTVISGFRAVAERVFPEQSANDPTLDNALAGMEATCAMIIDILQGSIEIEELSDAELEKINLNGMPN